MMQSDVQNNICNYSIASYSVVNLHSYDNSNYCSQHFIMVIYGLLEVATLVNCSLTLEAITGVQYVRLDLMMMLDMLHVDNQDIYSPVMSILTASMLTSLQCNCFQSLHTIVAMSRRFTDIVAYVQLCIFGLATFSFKNEIVNDKLQIKTCQELVEKLYIPMLKELNACNQIAIA